VPRAQIIAAGGALLLPDSGNAKLERYFLDATGKARPRVCFVPTASGDAIEYIARFGETYGSLGVESGVLRFFRRTPEDLSEFLAGFDLIHVGGGNTMSMLAVWRFWGFDAILREALARGIVLCGSSAGSICWFEQGITDSIAGPLVPMTALGFLAGSHCPHYDGEALRRPTYQRLVAVGEIAPGIACDDGAAAHFIDGELVHAVSARPSARVYDVVRSGDTARETERETRLL
jgi:peptidase E